MNYILRRNGVGEKIKDIEVYSSTGLKVVNKDTDPHPEGAEYVFRFGTTSNLPGNPKVVNSAEAIHKVYGKGTFRKLLSDNSLAPKCWVDFSELLQEFQTVSEHPDVWNWHYGWPVIVRPENHIRSLNLDVCSDIVQAYKAFHKHKKAYISEYIKKDSEYRVFVCSSRVVAVVRKKPTDPNAISWGCVDQGQFEYIKWNEWPLFATQKALQAFSLSGLDFGAVDVICLSAGNYVSKKAYVLEINTAPELTPYYLKSMTKCFDYIVKNGKDQMNYSDESWKHQIHPAISGEAKL